MLRSNGTLCMFYTTRSNEISVLWHFDAYQKVFTIDIINDADMQI